MGHGTVELVISSVVMLVIFVMVLLLERRYSRRSNQFFRRTEAQLDQLAEHAEQKYRERYGKDPTLPVRLPPTDKKKLTPP